MNTAQNTKNQTKDAHKYRANLHMCLVCGAGPFCADHVALHFNPCFDSHCPTSNNNDNHDAGPVAGPSKCLTNLSGHGFKTEITLWSDPLHWVPMYTQSLGIF
ncbi:Aste57867_9819 [Aphanomyces stellatus]|uniref:Aste57867_9819 protein n=1 Tax=Aphanomyces stellatus TaxID=120398 RepID=A0A485KNU7_9STRA|nr:hypothetical protein As57867_009780 [Aphanomyces stellatus]VFT86698.1 Aste57867_9819 [Aphanomyces stellatus]